LEIDNNRRGQIIKAAIKRFSHFGVAKTTMNEIAEDSSISKGNIYYYFADKNALIAEVIKELLNKFEKTVKKRLASCTSTLEALNEVEHSKRKFFEKYYMLHLFEGIDCSAGNENLKQIADTASEFGANLIMSIFEEGIKRGELTSFNTKEMAELYVESSRGLFIINQNFPTKRITIDIKQLDSIHHKQAELTKIFIKALSRD